MSRRAAVPRVVIVTRRHFINQRRRLASMTPNNPMPCKGIQIAYRRPFSNRRDERTAAKDAAVETIKVAGVAAPPGVTELGVTLQVACAGNPLQLRFTALVNDPPSGVTVNWKVAPAPGVAVWLFVELARLKSRPTPVSARV